MYLLTNKLDDVPGGLLVATAEPGLVTVQLLHDAHVALPDPHQDHADRQLAQSDEDPLGVLDVSDPAIRDEEDHSVLHLWPGPHGVISCVLQNLSIAGGLTKRNWNDLLMIHPKVQIILPLFNVAL